MGDPAPGRVTGAARATEKTGERGRRRLHRAAILAAAVALVDREGLAALTMRRLGRELGVEGMALYKHFPSKDALLDGMVSTLLAGMAIPPPDPDPARWREGGQAVAWAFRRLAHEHPALFPLVVARPLVAPEVLQPLEATLAILRAGGFDPATALRIFRTVASFVAGFALDEVCGPPPLASGSTPSPLAAFAGAQREAFPHVAELAQLLSKPDADADFAFGLDVIITGLEARHPDRSTPGAIDS